ncbi:YegP family protein [Oceanospirillum sanctuarii]|uniref:YegP family protein n=1 Tax=Oceanospirillum sanctuarii TaxID=1434821 RepID=UPI000A36B5CA|nr:YegP family protein [Oceanospirillum sanctuarii]
MSGKFEIFRSTANMQFYFRLKAANGQVILSSEGYVNKGGCENGIASVRYNATDDKQYNRKVARDGQFFFNLHAGNNQVIGVSEMYTTSGARDNGIESVKSNAPSANLIDLT